MSILKIEAEAAAANMDGFICLVLILLLARSLAHSHALSIVVFQLDRHLYYIMEGFEKHAGLQNLATSNLSIFPVELSKQAINGVDEFI